MKKILFFIITLICNIFLYSQSQNIATDIFKEYEKSVIYIEQSIYFDKKDFKYPDIFLDIEKKYDIKFINQYIRLGSGSGFFISKDGFCITNNHVIDTTGLVNSRNNITGNLIFELFDKVPKQEMNNILSKVQEDFTNLSKKSKFFLRGSVNRKDFFPLELLLSNQKEDMALLKAKDGDFLPVPLSVDTKLEAGNQILTLGFPFGMEKTITSGIISGLNRKISIKDFKEVDITDAIQIDAPINPGNSGGPMFDLSGTVVGINFASTRGAEGMHYSIPIYRLVNWLNKNNYGYLVLENSQLERKHFDILSKNNDFNIEKKNNEQKIIPIGLTVFFDYKENTPIFVNGKQVGVTPKIIKLEKEGKTVLRISSDEGYCEINVLVSQYINEMYTFKPEMKPYKGSLTIKSNVEKANISLDDKFIGFAPVNLKDIILGKHRIKISSPNYFDLTDDIILEKDKNFEKTYNLEKGYKINFKNKLIDNSIIIVNDGKIKKEYTDYGNLLFHNGKYIITIKNENAEEMTFDVEFINKNVDIEINQIAFKTRLILKGYITGTKIILDESTDITKKIYDYSGNIAIDIITGKHKLIFKNPSFSDDLIENILLKPNEEKIIKLVFSVPFNNSLKPLGVGLLTPGIIIFTAGSVILSYSIVNYNIIAIDDLTKYKTYAEYTIAKYTNISFFIAGVVVGGLGLCFIGVSIPMFIINKPINNKWTINNNNKFKIISLNFDFKYYMDRVSLGFKVLL